MNERKKKSSSFSFFFSNFDFLAVILLFNHNQDCFHSLFIMFFLFVIFFRLLSFCLVLFNSSVICLCKLFSSIHLEYRSVVIWLTFPFYLFLFCVFHFSKLLFRLFFIYSILLKHAAILIEKFGQTCMTKEQSEMLMLMNHPFARCCCTRPYVVRANLNH